jgi:hypothetical protein
MATKLTMKKITSAQIAIAHSRSPADFRGPNVSAAMPLSLSRR